MFKNIDLIKGGFKFCAVIGAGLILNNFVKAITPRNTSTIAKMSIVLGEYMIGNLFFDHIADEADKTWNDALKMFNKGE